MDSGPVEWVALLVGAGLGGAAAGSFAALLAWRLPRGRPVILARSACASCAVPLSALEMIPVLSWLVLRGRCRHCGAALPPALLAAEGLGLTWGLACAPVFGADPLALGLAVALAVPLLAIAWIDQTTGRIPDVLTLTLAGLALGLRLCLTGDPGPALLGGLGLGLAAWTLRAAYARLRHREGLGSGDVGLFAAAGLALPAPLLAPFVALAGLLGLGWGLAHRRGRGGAGAGGGTGPLADDQSFPFAPALLAALAVMLLVFGGLGPVDDGAAIPWPPGR